MHLCMKQKVRRIFKQDQDESNSSDVPNMDKIDTLTELREDFRNVKIIS